MSEMTTISPIVPEYEVFENERNALAFFLGKHPMLDQNDDNGPFWFITHNSGIIAGSGENQAVFPVVDPKLIATARERGVILLFEFEGQEPSRATPCYLAPD